MVVIVFPLAATDPFEIFNGNFLLAGFNGT